jgi:hypothetical protein
MMQKDFCKTWDVHTTLKNRDFVDSSKFSLKVVLLHNGNIHPSIPIAHSVHMKETYENMYLLLKGINYSKYGWKIGRDRKSHRVTPRNAVWLHEVLLFSL